jgi:predicted dehydrogenase
MTRIGVLGCGFWSKYQIAAWKEVPGAKVVAVASRNRLDAERAQSKFGIDAAYDGLETLLAHPDLDLIDVITSAGAHSEHVQMCAAHRMPVICQKPMAETLEDCKAMVLAAESQKTWFAVHENWRFQRPMRRLKELLPHIGEVHRARITFACSFPVFDNQPALKLADPFILSDIGSHLFDCVRYLFGEVRRLTCITARVHQDIRGEDVATVLMEMESGAAVTCELSYSSPLERESFPETYVLVEGELGSLEIERGARLRQWKGRQLSLYDADPTLYSWADPEYLLVQSSIVDCHRSLLQAFQQGEPAETSGSDNLKTMALVFACVASAQSGTSVNPSELLV